MTQLLTVAPQLLGEFSDFPVDAQEAQRVQWARFIVVSSRWLGTLPPGESDGSRGGGGSVLKNGLRNLPSQSDMSYAQVLSTAQCVMATSPFDDTAHGMLSWHSVSRLRHSAPMSPRRTISDLNDPHWQQRMDKAVQHVNEKVAYHIQSCIALPHPPHHEHPSSSPRHIVSRNRVNGGAASFVPLYTEIPASLLRPAMTSIVKRVSVTQARDRAQRELEAGAVILRALRRAIQRRQGREMLKSKRAQARCEEATVDSCVGVRDRVSASVCRCVCS